jgi:hypothetical protein
MSPSILDRSPDLQRLHEDCYELRITTGGHLVIDHVPYVTPSRSIAFGSLVSTLVMAGDHTANPVDDHSLYFEGEIPCDRAGSPLTTMLIETNQEQQLEAGLTVHHRFSCKPSQIDHYPDYHAKMTGYVAMLLTHARGVDPNVQATRAHPVVLPEDDPGSPFEYLDTASTRAEIVVISDKLRMHRVAIVGLGGTGAYILDLIAKTPIGEIHLFDGDDFLNHNAFRAPGAPDIEELNVQPTKVSYFARRYLKMKRRVIPHPYPVDERTVEELRAMDFVFLAAEGGGAKRLVIEKLEEFGLPFIDVGLSVDQYRGSLGGMVCVTTSTPTQRDHLRSWVDLSDPDPDDIYDQNIQVAELNALNAAHAVIRWKKLCGFYRDLGHEHFSAYTLDRNQLDNAVQS